MLLLVALIGCERPPEAVVPFPEDFAFGAATAGFQVEAGCPTLAPEVCEDRASDWYQWVTDPSIVGNDSLHVSGEPLSAGPGMWELFDEDIAQMEGDGVSMFRLSLEWSRLFPSGEAEAATTVDELAALADPDAVARYHEVLGALRSSGVEPLVTVNHYTLPLWVHDGVACHEDPETCEASGWLNGERILPLIELYAAFCGREFGGEVDTWATLNEPFATTLSGYLQPGEDRSAPPGLSLYGEGVVASLVNQIEAHAAMTDALREHDAVDASGDGTEVSVGLVLNMVAISPKDPDDADDVEAVDRVDYLYHRVFLDAVTEGAWDDDLDGVPDRTRPELADRLDWLGVNYYNEVKVSSLSFPIVSGVPVSTFYPEFSWEPYPEGLERVAVRAAEFGRPVIITENGSPVVADTPRILREHLEALDRALASGADVRGYLYWSWVDNYEWNHGMDLQFGLYRLGGVDKERVARPVMEDFRVIMAAGGLP